MRRIAVANGGEVEIPERLDTATFVKMMEEKLYRALLLLDDATIAAAGPRDLSAMIAMLTEKRNLLRGEPTSIIRTEKDRADLAQLSAMLLLECERRGIDLEAIRRNRLLERNAT